VPRFVKRSRLGSCQLLNVFTGISVFQAGLISFLLPKSEEIAPPLFPPETDTFLFFCFSSWSCLGCFIRASCSFSLLSSSSCFSRLDDSFDIFFSSTESLFDFATDHRASLCALVSFFSEA